MLQEFEACVTITRALLERRTFLVGCAPGGVGRADRSAATPSWPLPSSVAR
jgi:hypothetical protein